MKNNSKILTVILLVLFCSCSYSQNSRDTLMKGFITPPNSSKPRVWWHWMNGNITKDGIAKDLSWMKRVGIGGFMNFDAALGTPQIVEKRLTYMTPDWKDAFHFTAKLADSLHLEMAIAGSPGWSESGGPWVSPADGMKKIVWSETSVEGGTAFTGRLKKPPSVTGVFQNLPLAKEMSFSPVDVPQEFYQDIAVVAYKIPDTDIPMSILKPTVSSSSGKFTLEQLTDGDIATTNLLPSDTVHGFAWIQFTFEKPQMIKAITIVGGGDKVPFGLYGEFNDTRSLEVSDDGEHFRKVDYIPAGEIVEQTMTIPETTSKYFRITFKNLPALPGFGAMFGGNPEASKPPAATNINRTNNMMEEFLKRRGYSMIPWMPALTGHIVKSSEKSEQFLWDFRKTLSELVAENHYDQLTILLHQRGMKRYSESHESGRALIADGMEVKRSADIPMSAMWTPNTIGGEATSYKADIRESASVSHIYGQNLVAAESLTAIGNTWAFSPERLKPTADMELASGLNRFVIHTSVHQPSDDKIPGLGLGPFGQWFTRHETWAEQAKPWTTYLSRSSFMLQ